MPEYSFNTAFVYMNQKHVKLLKVNCDFSQQKLNINSNGDEMKQEFGYYHNSVHKTHLYSQLPLFILGIHSGFININFNLHIST